MSRFVRLALITLFSLLCTESSALAESAVDLISGFDESRISSCYPPDNEEAVSELSKLMFRVQKMDAEVLQSRVNPLSANQVVGDAVSVDGKIKSIKRLNVPKRLVEFLEFDTFYQIGILPDDADPDTRIYVIAPALKGALAADDRVSGSGVLIRQGNAQPAVVGVRRLKWFPAKGTSVGARMLSSHGVDLGALVEVKSRNRQSLKPEDGDAFYPMLAAAREVGSGAKSKPQSVSPANLLQSPQKLTGEWIRMQVTTVRITRIRVQNTLRQQQLGTDHYYQVDCRGELGKTEIVLERAKGETGDPIRFSNYYPVSLVTAKLPEFLEKKIRIQDGPGWVTSMLDHPVVVDGFFFRLWSYSTDFMNRQEAGKQFGPLIVAARFSNNQSDPKESGGVEYIGYFAAIAMVLGIAATAIWTRRNSKEDDAVKMKRQERTKISLGDDESN